MKEAMSKICNKGKLLRKMLFIKSISFQSKPTLGSAFMSSSSSPSPLLECVPPFSRYLMDNVCNLNYLEVED